MQGVESEIQVSLEGMESVLYDLKTILIYI